MIVVRPWCGLCNRLRTIGSAVKLAKEFNVDLRIDWFRCPIERWAPRCGMRAKFSDLFEPIGGVCVREKIHVRNDSPLDWYYYSGFNKHFYDAVHRHSFVEDFMRDPKITRWLWCWHNFCNNEDYSWLKPKDDIIRSVKNLQVSMPSNKYIGLHIRRSDNDCAKVASPIELFVSRIEDELSVCPETCFYLSSDDIDTRLYIEKRFRGKVFSQGIIGKRYTVDGERSALVDLLMLSRATKIFGSYWSSFSEVAAQLRGIPLEVVIKPGIELNPWTVG